MLLLIEEALADEASYPNRLAKPLTVDQNALLKQLKAKVKEVAEQLDLPQELLVRKKDYEYLLTSCDTGSANLPSSLFGWRKSVVGDKLLNYLKELITHK